MCKKSKHSPEYKAVVAPYYYEHGGCVAKGVLNLKMHDMPQLAIAQGDEISKAVSDFYELVHFDYATFVPKGWGKTSKYRLKPHFVKSIKQKCKSASPRQTDL